MKLHSQLVTRREKVAISNHFSVVVDLFPSSSLARNKVFFFLKVKLILFPSRPGVDFRHDAGIEKIPNGLRKRSGSLSLSFLHLTSNLLARQ